jgi:hypothetical protein
MALIERGRVAWSIASTTVTLTAPANEAYRVRRVCCVPSSNDTYLILSVAGSTVGKMRVKGKAGNHCPYPGVYTASTVEKTSDGVFGLFEKLGKPLTIPVESGQSFVVTRYAEAGEVGIVYDVYDPADVKRTEPNGSAASIIRYLHYLNNSAAYTATPGTINASAIWTGGPGWPISPVVVPDKSVIRLLAILGSPCATAGGATTQGCTSALVLMRNSDPILDDAGAGIRFLGDIAYTTASTSYKNIASLIGAETAELPTPAFILPEPMEFAPGERLTLQVVCNGLAAAGIAASAIDIALALELELKS